MTETEANTTTAGDLAVANVTKEFATEAGVLRVLNGVNFSMQRGEAIAITGPSGSGKSTLLYAIGTLEEPTSGTIKLLDKSPFSLTNAELAEFRNRNVGFIFQDHNLLPQCSVLENVLIATLPGSGAGKEEEARAKELLERVGLAERIHHRPAQLSGGERQRVAVCRALINQPSLVLADEPTGNLDQKTAETVGALLLELNAELNTMLICVTHSLDLAARFPRRLDLQEGFLVPQDMESQPS